MYQQQPAAPAFGAYGAPAYGAPAPAFGDRAPAYGAAAATSWNAPQASRGASKKNSADPVMLLSRWLKARSTAEKTLLGVVGGVLFLVLLWFVVEDHDTLFVVSEVVHFIGIGMLSWKLVRKRNSGGLSLKAQELTALFLTVRLFCSVMMEYDVHTLLDLLTLGATGAVVYALRGPLRDSYQADMDVTRHAWVVGPCLALALVAHPSTRHSIVFRVLWALCVYLEAVSVVPQLRMMQRAKVVEKFTAHYVFALGLSRFVSCAHWVLQIMDGDRYLWAALGSGLWPVMVLLSEVVQTFVLADFCYYYVRSYTGGSGVVHLPSGVV